MPVHALPAPVRVHMLSPLTFNDAQEIGDRVKSGASVFLDMRAVDRELEERLRDFVAGLTSALEGSVTDVAHGILLVAPPGVNVSGGHQESEARAHTPGHRTDGYYGADAEVTPLFRSMSA
jgi:FtsZ-interacting cell division protein YlmF